MEMLKKRYIINNKQIHKKRRLGCGITTFTCDGKYAHRKFSKMILYHGALYIDYAYLRQFKRLECAAFSVK